jgi:adenylosuccinate synthase
VFETLPGWECALDGDTLPDAAHDYVRFVEDALGVPVALVGTGQGREAVLALPSS